MFKPGDRVTVIDATHKPKGRKPPFRKDDVFEVTRVMCDGSIAVGRHVGWWRAERFALVT